MKYAYIAMIVIYLITFGCNPDKAEKATEDHGSATPTTVEKPHQEEAPAVVHQQEQNDTDHKTVAAAEHQETAVEAVEQPATEELAPESQWEDIAKSAGVTVAALMDADSQPTDEKKTTEAADSDQVLMPCGKMMAQKDIPPGAPCAAMRTQAPGDGSQDITAAMQKIVEATNEMVMVTRQLVIATQEMLDASKAAAVETTNTDKK